MRRTISLMVCLALLIALSACRSAIVAAGAPEAARGDWPRWRGPDANGISPETGINKNWQGKAPRLLWKVEMTDDGYAGPAVAGGLVYVLDHQGGQEIVKALNLQTGEPVWKRVYDDTDKPNYGYGRSTPVVDAGKVYTVSRLGLAHCMDARTGEVVWKRDLIADFNGRRPGWDLAGSPLIDGDRVVFCTGGENAAVVALDKNTGKTVWQGGGSEVPGYGTPVIATLNGVKQYVVFFAKSVGGVDAASGKLLWSFPWQTSYDVNAPTPLVIGNDVFITSGYGRGCALIAVTTDGARAKWENKEICSRFTSPVLYQGHLYCTSEPSKLVCLDPGTGKALWTQTGFEWGGVLAADGTLIAFNGSNGDLIMVRPDPAGYHEMGRITPLGGQSWTAPILASGKLIVRNKSALACLDMR